MAHSDNIISSIKLPDGVEYEIHDAHAIHSAEELGLSAALVFKGTKDAVGDLPSTGNKVGDVWYVTADDCEYVWTEIGAWEAFGNVHDAASSNHTHTVTVTGTNVASVVTGQVTVPTVSKIQKYMTATASKPEVTATTKQITASASDVVVGADGTANAITALGAPTTGAALGANATFAVSGGAASTSKMVTSTASKVSVTERIIPNVVDNTAVKASKLSNAGSKTNGTAASWNASVTNGVLSFDWTANTPTAVTLPTFDEVTATNTTLGTAISASAVTADDVTVATGALAANGAGSAVATGIGAISVAVDDAKAVSAITGFGTHTTKSVLTGVKVSAQPTITVTNGDSVVTGVEVAPSTITLSDTATSGLGFVSAVEIGSANAELKNGSAAAQTWTQVSGSTGAPQ